MRIGIDAHTVEDEGIGNATFTRNLIEALAVVDGTNQYVLYAEDPRHYFYAAYRERRNFRIRALVPRAPAARLAFTLGTLTWLDRLDVLHVVYFAPLFHRGGLVVTIHDSAFQAVPDSFRTWDRVRYRALFAFSARRADRITTGSLYSKADTERLYRIPGHKVVVTYAGVSTRFRPLVDHAAADGILCRYGIRRPFVLYVGRLNERKQLREVICAFARTARWHSGGALQLVLVGKPDYLRYDLRSVAAAAGCGDRVVLTGFVPDEDLPLVYGAAELFVYPSRFEGIGLPVLEAMACGVPTIASTRTSLPEVAGDAAILVDPDDVEELGRQMLRVLSDRSLRVALRRKGLEHVRTFSWESTARSMLDVYVSVCDETAR